MWVARATAAACAVAALAVAGSRARRRRARRRRLGDLHGAPGPLGPDRRGVVRHGAGVRGLAPGCHLTVEDNSSSRNGPNLGIEG